MSLDIRIPIGGMFALLGLIVAAYGILTSGDAMYARSLGTNINSVWGGVMLLFGIVMLLLGLRKKPALSASAPAPEEGGSPRHH